ncbi:MAG: archaetidylserine decarboxylase [Thiohalocapsa sp.]
MHDPQNNGGSPLSIAQRLFVGLQYILPQHLLSGLMFRLTRLRMGPLTRLAIRGFVRAFDVDLSEAQAPSPDAYATFNAFFTRALRPDARPIDADPAVVVSPVDGVVSQIGDIESGRIFQAKGRDFGCKELLGGDAELASRFNGGAFATLYLSPRDYHRIHMPCEGSLRSTVHIPGRLFSVNPTTAAAVPGLFARNERVVCLFDTALGPMAVVLVGAIFVGSIETVWSGRITPPRGSKISRIEAGDEAQSLPRGAELGRFNMGSTVILLLPPDSIHWNPGLAPGAAVRCGNALALPQR